MEREKGKINLLELLLILVSYHSAWVHKKRKRDVVVHTGFLYDTSRVARAASRVLLI